MYSSRFNKVRGLLTEDKVILISRTEETDFFKVGEYEVSISDKHGLNCTCENGSCWRFSNKKGGLPCSHCWAALCSYIIRRTERIKEQENTI